MNDLNKLSIKHRLTFNHKLANSMSEKAKQGAYFIYYFIIILIKASFNKSTLFCIALRKIIFCLYFQDFFTIIASFAIGIMTDLIGAGRLLSIWPDMPAPLASTVDFFATTSMARVLVFALIVVFLQFKPSGLFPQKGRMIES